MAELVNEFSWSPSRAQAFESCRRRYWFRYYAHWNGWKPDAPELARQAYFFTKMTSLKLLLGSAVHETIADVLRAARSGRAPKSPFDQVRARMNDAWLASRQERWREHGPKRAPPLFEHYYRVEVTAEEIDRLRESALLCVRNFLEGDTYRDLMRAGPSNWRTIDSLEVTVLGGVRAFVAPDFAFDLDGVTRLVDWKTGESRDEHELQLLAYACFARERWRIDPARMRACDVLLASGKIVEVPISAERLDATIAHVRANAEAMRAVLADRDGNVARREDLLPTTDARECRRCSFREICPDRPQEEAVTSPRG